MPRLFDDSSSTQGVQDKGVEELLLLVGDEEKGYKPEALERLLEMGLEENYPAYELAVRNDQDADLRNSAMEVLVTFGKPAIPKLIKLLRDTNEEVRNFSCVMLGDIGSREAVGALIRTLGDPDTNVSHSAAEALGKIGDRAALMPLVELLKGEFWLQYAAISAIGAMRDYRAVPHLLQLLDNELLARPVIEALGKIGDPRTLYPLGNMLPEVDDVVAGVVAKAIVAIYCNLNEVLSFKNSLSEYTQPEQLKNIITPASLAKLRLLLTSSSDPEVIEAVITLLGWVGDASALTDVFDLLVGAEYMKSAESAILAMGKQAAGHLVAALSHKNDNARIIAIRSLRWLDLPIEPEVMAQHLHSANVAIQLEALESLREGADEGLLSTLFALLQEGGHDVSIKAAEVIGSYPLGTLQVWMQQLLESPLSENRRRLAMLFGYLRSTAPRMIERLAEDADPLVRKEIVRAIGLQPATELIPLLRRRVDDPDDTVREEAIKAMAEYRDKSLLPEILNLLGRFGESLDYTVVKAVGTIGASEGGRELMEYLERDEVPRRVEYAIIDTLGRIAYKPASPLVDSRYLQHQDPDIRRLAVEILGNLGDKQSLRGVETAVNDPHWSVRIAALHVLAKIGGADEIPMILAAMTDKDVMVRKHAIITLGELRNITTVPELVMQLTDMEMSRHAFEALLKFGRSCLPWLHRLMKKDYSLEIRERVIDLIGKIGDRRSVEPLMELLEDHSPTIRLAAIDSLAFCFDSVLLKKLSNLKKKDLNDEVKARADLALKTLTMEKFF